MREAVETVYGNECAEVGYSFHLAFHDIVLGDVCKELLFLGGFGGFACVLFFLKDDALRCDYLLPSAVLLYFDEAEP